MTGKALSQKNGKVYQKDWRPLRWEGHNAFNNNDLGRFKDRQNVRRDLAALAKTSGKREIVETHVSPSHPEVRRPRRVFVVSVLYLLAMIGTLVLMYAGGDWWPVTLLLYGPRWMLAAPLVLLLPWAVWRRAWRSGLVLLAAGLVVVGPITGGTISPVNAGRESDDRGRLRVLTCNVNGNRVNRQALKSLIARTKPDIVMLQEAEAGLADALFGDGWHVSPGTLGLCVASRFPITNIGYLEEKQLGSRGAIGRYRVESRFGELTIVNIHLPTPRDGIEMIVHRNSAGIALLREQIALREMASARARTWLGELGPTVIVAGDFNMPVEAAIYRRHWSDLGNAFSEGGWGWGYTKQTRWFGARIDHVLYGKAWRCGMAEVQEDVGSDHLPVIADFLQQQE